MPEYIATPAHARAKPAYLVVVASDQLLPDGRERVLEAEYWTPFVTPLSVILSRTAYDVVRERRPRVLGITDNAALLTHLPPFE